MNVTDYEKGDRQISRSEKIRIAKSAFAQGSGRNTAYGAGGYSRTGMTRGFYDAGRDTVSLRYGVTDGSEDNLDLEEGRHHFGMLRMVTAGVLFFVLVLSFHFGISYEGYDKEYVEQVLSDNSRWENLMEQVAQVVNQNVEKSR